MFQLAQTFHETFTCPAYLQGQATGRPSTMISTMIPSLAPDALREFLKVLARLMNVAVPWQHSPHSLWGLDTFQDFCPPRGGVYIFNITENQELNTLLN